MRIDRLELQNFKCFANAEFRFAPRFNLLIGGNGRGKTAVLDALAVALGIWLAKPPAKALASSARRIVSGEVRLTAETVGDRLQFTEHKPVVVTAEGMLAGREGVCWARAVSGNDPSTNNGGSSEALAVIQELYEMNGGSERPALPVIAFYGAGRGWIASRQRPEKAKLGERPASRYDAYSDCFNERIRMSDLNEWFLLEMAEAGKRGGRPRPGFEVVRRAVRDCMPDCDLVDFASDRREITARIGGAIQPFSNLSAGQKMMVALIADLAIKAVTLNAQLLPKDALGPEDEPLPRVLRETQGVVLIDELDVHLHPIWQRRVASDLKRTFPSVQFICTSHSPQVIGEVLPSEVQILGEQFNQESTSPTQALGMDSNWILEVVQQADERDPKVKSRLKNVFAMLARKQLREAEDEILKLRGDFGNSGEVQRAMSQLERIKLLGR